MKNILVLCTGNSCRSQMAEAYLRLFAGNKAQIKSAGVEVHGLNPRAVKIMAEDSIDISSHSSNNVSEYLREEFDWIITVCDHAKESCPYFPGKALRIHKNFYDPAKATGTEEEVMSEFRKTRNEIKNWCRDFVQNNL
ncbi:MAG: arsenate reductase ArsC [Bacteroidetes bacterium]|nr:MAG: arsenate reductase ArsC [Bacteroidota bacterium]REK03534.1 MAG: arsenate reductase ArsC [Bacteroidota bacterium]REK34837.1 MAG: arsenate reductase ArsC [Bacteroidota bacterium]REK51208.1 MAG: arsenate reductase ArsC [Bacteroidota bacterium]